MPVPIAGATLRAVNERRGLLLIVAAAGLWGTTGTAQALGPATSDPVAVGVLRLVVAAPALVLISRVSGGAGSPHGRAWKPTVLAGAAIASYQPLFFTAVAATGVALGTVVTIGSAPVMAGLLSWMVDRELPSRRWWPATALGVAGVTLIVFSGNRVGADATGIILALGAGLSFAIYITASRRVVVAVDPIVGTARTFAIGALLSLPLLPWVDLGWIGTLDAWIMAAHLGLIATALSYVLFSLGIRTTRTPTAATASLAEPVTATLLGVVLLNEAPGILGWSGILLILTGLILLASHRPMRNDKRPGAA